MKKQILLSLLVLLVLFGCTGPKLTYFDNTTYQNLTELKPLITRAYDSFSEAEIDQGLIDEIELRFDQIWEYENGKGEGNQETVEQIEILHEMFRGHVNNRLNGKSWNDTVLMNFRENIADAFDTAIETEWLKNRGRNGR